ncbi:hypothetical protein STRTUCAR8_00128 [Streptomyces turgidiscabies Car8]|uniref:Uncharacterized protein n=1 Tax=Streptomyces turgidiscabies (strain Car8) TaxID=698760 RepID=L7FA14_STRT8|nr:hypothetical protein STRTUCAR8_00128 [Streptomyces turgidiscabies Car8]
MSAKRVKNRVEPSCAHSARPLARHVVYRNREPTQPHLTTSDQETA